VPVHYLLRRVAASLLLLLLVVTITFVLLRLGPGKPIALLQEGQISAVEKERLIHAFGLDRPLGEQYAAWLRQVVLHFDWGTSFSQQRAVTTIIGEALPATLLLAGAALLVVYGLGVSLGVAAACSPGGMLDRAIRLGSLLLYSQPAFWLGLMAVLLFAHRLGWFPSSHMHSVGAQHLPAAARWADLGRHLVLPALTIGLAEAGGAVRFVRASLLDVLGRDYIRTARAKGLPEWRVIWVHGLRAAAVPLTQLLGLSVPSLLSGALTVEVIFAWPGLGRIAYDSILARDYPVVVATTAFSAALVVAGNLAADLLHAAADPRLREGGADA
jgi:peptide/nickel transport system permease protein